MSKKKYLVYFLLFVVVCIGIFYRLFSNGNTVPEYEPVTVKKGTVEHIVSVSGHIEPVDRVTLSFSMGGIIENIFPTEDDEVVKGTTVATLRGGVLQASLSEAEMRVSRERAVLRDLLAPLRKEERALKDTAVTNAERNVERAISSARTAIARAFVLADDAVRDKADELFSSNTSSPKLGVTFDYGSTKYFITADPSTTSYLNQKRSDVERILITMSERTKATDESVEQSLVETESDLAEISDFLTELALIANKYKASDSVNQTVYESYQNAVAVARTSINTSRTEIATAHTALTTAEAGLSLALRDLDLTVAGVSEDTILAQEASVASAIAGVQTSRERLEESRLVAPFDGVIVRVNKKAGEAVSPFEPFVELMTEGAIEIEAYIPEADIAHVKLGDSAEVTFDAFGKSEVFYADVVRIALTETLREGVPTYKTTLQLTDGAREGLLFRAGMTANVDVLTNKREGVLYIPVRSLLREGTRTYVKVFEGGEFKEKNITTGLRGSEGTVEVVSGLREREEVVLYVKEK